MKLEKTLQDFGLTDKQVKVYLACLQLGQSTVQKIAKKTSMPRSTVYEVLEGLQKKSLVSTYLKKKVKYFTAQDPDQLVSLAQNKADTLKRLLPELNALFGKARLRPSVRFYDGKEGMKIILEEILSEARDLTAFTTADDLFKELGACFYTFVEKRVKKKIPVRVIFNTDTPKARERMRLAPKELRKVKILNGDYEHHGMVFIWQNKVAMFSFTNDYVAIVIESRELADVQRAMFDSLWDRLD